MARRRKRKPQHSLEFCYFCGGTNPATTRDHVPPKACFPDGFAPEGFEFPACKICNEGTVKQDQIFGMYSMLLDFDESKMSRPEDLAKFQKLKQGVLNNYPDALPDQSMAQPIYHSGAIHTLIPSAISVKTTPALKEAIGVMGKKLTHALYLRDSGKILTPEHQFLTSVYQPQSPGTDTLTSYFYSLLPKGAVGARRNIQDYGDRFKYMSGYMADQDFFVFATQFGRGLILWGIVRGPLVQLPDSGPLKTAPWLRGACGAGAKPVGAPK